MRLDKPSLTVLIPSYKRPEGLLRAIRSVNESYSLSERRIVLKVIAVDDASPGLEANWVRSEIESIACDTNLHGIIHFSQNPANKGMSRNIFEMVEQTTSDFLTILTDDDLFHKHTLSRLEEMLCEDSFDASSKIGCYLFPRFSYLEDGSLHAIACRPFRKSRVIPGGPLSSARHGPLGFILTGTVFRRTSIDLKIWASNIDNGYFPVIFTGLSLLANPALYVDENLFHHTVLNETHWESWGATEVEQRIRLDRDYINAILVVSEQARNRANSLTKLWLKILALQQVTFRFSTSSLSLQHRRSVAQSIPTNRFIVRSSFVAHLVFRSFVKITRRAKYELRDRRQLRTWAHSQ